MYRTSAVREMSLNGLGPMTTRVQIDCYDQTYAGAIASSRAVRSELEGYAGGTIQGAFLDTIRDGFEDDADFVYRVSLSFVITHTA